MRNDEELRRDVLNELRRDECLRDAELDVKVERRVVTLTGEVLTAAERWRALELARHVAGIAPISHRITVLHD
ncbi:MAG TPA: BON domain-containing protein [Pyrinomonadaceae bacterium]|nr:BON domain-containing protein [Pyrinomonadaceae bacterium]